MPWHFKQSLKYQPKSLRHDFLKSHWENSQGQGGFMLWWNIRPCQRKGSTFSPLPTLQRPVVQPAGISRYSHTWFRTACKRGQSLLLSTWRKGLKPKATHHRETTRMWLSGQGIYVTLYPSPREVQMSISDKVIICWAIAMCHHTGLNKTL